MSTSLPAPASGDANVVPLSSTTVSNAGRLRRCLRALPSARRALIASTALVVLGLAAWLLGRQAWASHHFRAAQAAWQHHHYETARAHLQVCQTVWPDDAATLLLTARIARRQQAFEQADALLDRYHQVRGADDDLTLERVLVRAERGDLDSVRAFCEQLVADEHPQTPLILEALAAGSLRMFRINDAAFYLHQWRDRFPDDAQADYLQGFTVELGGQLQDAIAAYRRAVELDPEHFEARLRLAMALLDLSQAPEALPHVRWLVARQPGRVAALVELARCLVLLGEPDEAERTLDGALALQPHDAGALRERGLFALRQGQLDQAESWLRQAGELTPGHYQVHYQLALCWQRQGKTEEARALQPRLKQMEDDAHRLRELVVEHLARAPNDPDLLHEMGVIALRVSSAPEGLRWFDAALKADPKHAPTHAAYAEYYESTGQFSRAAEHRAFVPAKKGP